MWFASGLGAAIIAVVGALLVVSAPGKATWAMTEDARVQIDARAELLRRRAEFARILEEHLRTPLTDSRAVLEALLTAQSTLNLLDHEIDEEELAILYALAARVAVPLDRDPRVRLDVDQPRRRIGATGVAIHHESDNVSHDPLSRERGNRRRIRIADQVNTDLQFAQPLIPHRVQPEIAIRAIHKGVF